MNIFERTRLISARALQLYLGAPPLVKPEKGADFVELARIEFEKGVIPLKVINQGS